MSEANPSKKKRWTRIWSAVAQQMSNTAEEGELCLYTSVTPLVSFSSTSMRYDSHQACVRCVAGATRRSPVI